MAEAVEYNPDKMNLGEIFRHHGTDKDRNGYTRIYEPLFKHRRAEELLILEIGIGTIIPTARSSMHNIMENYQPGASLRAWRDYFPNSIVWGLDVTDDTMIDGEERIHTFRVDSTSSVQVIKFWQDQEMPQFDIIVDDGDHYDAHQLRTFENLWPFVKAGGYYITEDLCGQQRFPLHGEFSSRVHKIMGRDDTVFVNKSHNIAVFSKAMF